MRETTGRHQGQWRRRGRRCSRSQSRDSSAGCGETTVEQLCPCSPWYPRGMQRSTRSPWGSPGDAEIHPQPLGRCPRRSGRMPAGGCGPGAEPLQRGPAPRLEQPGLEELTPWKSDPRRSSFGGTAARQIGPTSEMLTENSLPWEGTPRSHRGTTPLPEHLPQEMN